MKPGPNRNLSSAARPMGGATGGMLPAAILMALAAAVWIASFVSLAQTEVRVSQSAFQFNASLNLAEGGAELALFALHNDEWDDWSLDGADVVMDTATVNLGRAITGTIDVRIRNYATNPFIMSEGVVFQPNLPPVTRRLEIRLDNRTPWGNGLTGNSITIRGNRVEIDSYDSREGAYNPDERNENGSVATRQMDSMDLGHAKVYGDVATGGGEPDVGPHGYISGTVTTDFSADFPPVTPPSTYQQVIVGAIEADLTLGTPGATEPTVYRIDAIKLNNATLNIAGPVVLHVTGDIDIGGSTGSIDIAEGGSVKLYADRDISVSGSGTVNIAGENPRPEKFQVFGTAPSHQKFSFSGNAAMAGAIYAPYADIDLNGGGNTTGEFFGSITANNITMNGTYHFHYDESLRDVDIDSTYRLAHWRELHTAFSSL